MAEKSCGVLPKKAPEKCAALPSWSDCYVVERANFQLERPNKRELLAEPKLVCNWMSKRNIIGAIEQKIGTINYVASLTKRVKFRFTSAPLQVASW